MHRVCARRDPDLDSHDENLLMRYDLFIIGDDTAGLDAARAAAMSHHRVAIAVENEWTVQTGAHLSRTIRDLVPELAVELRAGRFAYAEGVSPRPMVDVRKLIAESICLGRREWQMEFNDLGVDLLCGQTRFRDAHTVSLHGADECIIEFETAVIATGSESARPAWIPFSDDLVVDCDGVLSLEFVPPSLAVIGATNVGLEFALLFASLGTEVTLIDAEPWPSERVNDGLIDRALELGVDLRLGDDVIGIDRVCRGPEPGPLDFLAVRLASGSPLLVQTAMYAGKRMGRTLDLELGVIGIEVDESERIWVDADCRTWLSNVFAVGDVVGFRPATGRPVDEVEAVLAGLAPSKRVPAPSGLLKKSSRRSARRVR